MKMNWTRIVLAVVACGLTSSQVVARTVIAQCESLRGPRVDYSDDFNSGQHQLQQSDDNFGPRTFVWDSDKPDVLQYLKSGRYFDGQKPGEVAVEILNVATITTGAIVAVDVYGNGVYTYTLWPARGFVVMTRASAQTRGAVGALYFAKCEVSVN